MGDGRHKNIEYKIISPLTIARHWQ